MEQRGKPAQNKSFWGASGNQFCLIFLNAIQSLANLLKNRWLSRAWRVEAGWSGLRKGADGVEIRCEKPVGTERY
jgi:hypothetical protein